MPGGLTEVPLHPLALEHARGRCHPSTSRARVARTLLHASLADSTVVCGASIDAGSCSVGEIGTPGAADGASDAGRGEAGEARGLRAVEPLGERDSRGDPRPCLFGGYLVRRVQREELLGRHAVERCEQLDALLEPLLS